MNLFKAVVLSFLLVSNGFANGTLTCPTSVTAGQTFSVQVKVSNADCWNSITITDIMLTMVGSDAANAISVLGPYVTNINPSINLAKATCTWNSMYYMYDVTNTSIGPYSLQSTAPASMKGKLMLFSAAYLNSNNENALEEIGNCKIIVR